MSFWEIFCFATAIILIVLQVLYLRWLTNFSTKVESQKVRELSGISVLICVKNDIENLIKLLDSIIVTIYQNYEVVIVYENVSKRTIESLKQRYDNNNVRFIECEKSTVLIQKKNALNTGIKLAKYEWIATTDADCSVLGDWIKKMVDEIERNNASIFVGTSIYKGSWRFIHNLARYDSVNGAIKCYKAISEENAYMGMGRNMAFKKSLWSRAYLDTYRKIGHGDDSTLVNYWGRRKGVKIASFCNFYTVSIPENSFWKWIKQKIRHISVGRKMKSSSVWLLSIEPTISVLFWMVMWIWLSFLAFHFAIFGLVLIYCIVKMGYFFRIESKLNVLKKSWIFVPFFDFLYQFSLLSLPILSIFYRGKWK